MLVFKEPSFTRCPRRTAEFPLARPNGLSFLSHMHLLVENLVKLQAVELERARVIQAIRQLAPEVAQAEAALGKAQSDASNASSALSREESLRNRLERETEGHRQKAARVKAQQNSVTNPAQAAAIEHELEFARVEIERLENEELVSLER